MSTAVVTAGSLRQAELDAVRRSNHTYYTGTGRDDTSSKKGKASNVKKRAAALMIVIGLAIGGMAFLGSSNSLLAGAFEALVTEATDTQNAAGVLRSNFLYKYFLKNGEATTTTWKGTKKYAAMSNGFKKRLADYNIEVEGSGAGKALVFTKQDVDGNDIVTRVTADQFDDVFKTDLDFREAYTGAKRGRAEYFFDKAADEFYSFRQITRNLWNKFFSSGDSDADTGKFNETMTSHMDSGDVNLKSRSEWETEEVVTDENGNIIYDIDENGNRTPRTEKVPHDKNGNGSAQISADVDAEASARSFIDNVAEGIGGPANAVCTLIRIKNLVAVTVSTAEMVQTANYFLGLVENISKMKAGNGNSAAINEFLNMLSIPKDSSVPKYTNGTVSGTLNQHGAPLESQGLRNMLAYAPANASTVESYSLDRLANGGGLTPETLRGCAASSITTGIVSLAATFTPVGLAKLVGGFFIDVGVGTLSDLFISSALAFAIPTIAQVLFTNRFENLTGIPSGESMAEGAGVANMDLGRNGSGQNFSSEEVALEYGYVNNSVLAMEAELDRHKYSPFDISNKNTFFGSIAYSLLPAVTSTKTTSLASLLRTTAKSFSSLLTSVHADGEGSGYTTTFGDCPTLESIGAVGTVHCVSITTTDPDTIELEPTDETFNKFMAESTECDDDGECDVKKGSNLYKYIAYCDSRTSYPGILDANILSDMQFSTGNSIIDSVVNSLPIISDVISIMDSLKELDEETIMWANGGMCVNNDETNPKWDEEIKYYQRYVEDERQLTNRGAFGDEESTDSSEGAEGAENSEGTESSDDSNNEESITFRGGPALTAKQQYLAEHPIEETPEGVLAYFTGMTKEDATFTIALLEYANFIDEYDPTVRIAMQDGDTTVIKSGAEIAQEIQRENYHFKNTTDLIHDTREDIIIAKRVVYADIRNRNYTV